MRRSSFTERMAGGAAQAALSRHRGKAWGGVRRDRFARRDPRPSLDDLIETALAIALARAVDDLNGRPAAVDDPPF